MAAVFPKEFCDLKLVRVQSIQNKTLSYLIN